MQIQHLIRAYVENNIRNGVWKFVLRTVAKALDLLITLAVGYEMHKITSGDQERTIWTFVEFFTVIALCILIWIMKCCCLNRFCITCCINCVVKRNGQDEEIDQNVNENEDGRKMGPIESVLEKIHMVLNRLAIGAIGYELRKQLFKFKPLTTWDYVEISIIALFCLWILTIKYCVLKCHCLKICCCCCYRRFNGRTAKKNEDIALKCTQNEIESVNVDHNGVNEQLHLGQQIGWIGTNEAVADVYNQVQA